MSGFPSADERSGAKKSFALAFEYTRTERTERGVFAGAGRLSARRNTGKRNNGRDTLEPVEDRIYLWQGDITTLKCGAIVNAANSRLLGCFAPCHLCIDNAIHTFAGVQLRLECNRIMAEQGYPEPTGKAKLTKAYNLPSEYVLHTVGPIIGGKLTEKDEKELASCYTNCLALAAKKGIKSVAFCCISTGEFHFPNETAAHIAIKTVRNFLKANKDIKVIFNVFLQKDLDIYRRIFGING